MAKLSLVEQWDAWMVQAQNFAKRENYIDAMARAGLVIDAVEKALATAQEGGADKEAARLTRYLARATRRQATFEADFHQWNEKIAARRAASTAASAEEMARPLPLPADELV